MAVLWIDLIGSVSLQSKHLMIHGFNLLADGSKQESNHTAPLVDVERVMATHKVSFTSNCLAELMQQQIPLYILHARRGDLLGCFEPASHSSGELRLLQYRRNTESVWMQQVANKLIAAKIANQRRILQRLGNSRQTPVDADVAFLKSLIPGVEASSHMQQLMGFEGVAAARFLSQWSRALPEEFPFVRRSKRPPLNAVNACISYLATILYGEMQQALKASGLDASLGIVHSTQNNRWSLALDLLEPFRPVLIEALTMDLFSHHILDAGCFEPYAGGIYLSREGRSRLLKRYEQRMLNEYDSEQRGHRTTLRQQIRFAAYELKQALHEPDNYNPFRLN